jgi:hypothetical protein
VFSQGNSAHSKHSFTPLPKAQLQILQNLFSLGTHPIDPFGQLPFCIFGHFSHAIPQTPIFTFQAPVPIMTFPYLIIFLWHN